MAVECVHDDLLDIFSEVVPVIVSFDFNPFFIEQGITVVNFGWFWFLDARSTLNKRQRKNVDLLAFDLFVDIHNMLTCFLILNQKGA